MITMNGIRNSHFGAVAFGIVACASTPMPVEKLAVAKNSLDRAEQAQAAQFAQVELSSARNKYAAAQAAADKKDADVAARLADQADVDAQLAESTARAKQQQQLVAEMEAGLRDLWGNVRDKLTYGQLDASHALLGMPVFSHLRRDWFPEPLIAVMSLGSGGNAITLSDRLSARASAPARRSANSSAPPETRGARRSPTCSAARCTTTCCGTGSPPAGIDPDNDVRLRVFPPNQMPAHGQRVRRRLLRRRAVEHAGGTGRGRPDRRGDGRHHARTSRKGAGRQPPVAAAHGAVPPRWSARCCGRARSATTKPTGRADRGASWPAGSTSTCPPS